MEFGRSGLAQSGRDKIVQPAHAAADILDHSVDEEAGRRPQMAPPSARLVLANSLTVDLILHLGLEPRHVQSDLRRTTFQVMQRQMPVVGQQKIMHFPELALGARGFGGLRRRQRMRMGIFHGEMPKDEAH